MRPVRRQAPDGHTIQDLLIQITQRRPGYLDEDQQQKENKRYLVEAHQPIGPKRGDFLVSRRRDADPGPRELRCATPFTKMSSAPGDSTASATTWRAPAASLRELYFGAADTGQRLAAMHSSAD